MNDVLTGLNETAERISSLEFSTGAIIFMMFVFLILAVTGGWRLMGANNSVIMRFLSLFAELSGSISKLQTSIAAMNETTIARDMRLEQIERDMLEIRTATAGGYGALQSQSLALTRITTNHEKQLNVLSTLSANVSDAKRAAEATQEAVEKMGNENEGIKAQLKNIEEGLQAIMTALEALQSREEYRQSAEKEGIAETEKRLQTLIESIERLIPKIEPPENPDTERNIEHENPDQNNPA